MNELHYTLLSDGSSDQALIPLLKWLLRQQGVACAIQESWADLRKVRRPPSALVDRIRMSVDLFRCDLLFVHRDAESQPRTARVAEVAAALNQLPAPIVEEMPPVVCVVPVRMLEAWLLFDLTSLRSAADNPRGRMLISLPPLSRLEREPDPKATLYGLLRAASGYHGRRLKQFRPTQAVQRLADLIGDYSPLRALPAFAALEEDVARAVQANGRTTLP